MLRFLVLFCSLFSFSAFANVTPDFADLPKISVDVAYVEEASIAKISWSCNESFVIKMFICEKSLDGKHFTQIAKVIVGNTQYLEFDEDAREDIQFYRVVTYLNNGEIIISDTLKATKSKQNQSIEAIFYPNPVIERANIKISNYNNTPVNIAMYNSDGREVYSVVDQLGSLHEVICKQLPSGTYFIKATVDGEVFIEKIDIVD